MRSTNVPRVVFQSVAVLLGALAVVAIVTYVRAPDQGAGGLPSSVDFSDALPADEMERLDITATLIPRSEAVVKESEALAVAEREEPGLAEAARETSAHLLRVTDAGSPVGVEEPIVDRPLWIVRYAGIGYRRADPSMAPGVDALPSVRVLDHAYVYIDALTGMYLSTTLVQ